MFEVNPSIQQANTECKLQSRLGYHGKGGIHYLRLISSTSHTEKYWQDQQKIGTRQHTAPCSGILAGASQ
jgi:hypothetical protein